MCTPRWLRGAVGWGAAVVLLGACAQTPPVCPGNGMADLRVMVRFQAPVADAGGDTLQRLQALSQGCVQAVSSVSPTVHVYRFSGVAGLPLLRQRLLAWSAVQDVQPDHTVHNKTAP